MMRVWDTELLTRQSGIVQKATLTVSQRLTDAGDIYSTYFEPFMTDVTFLHAVVEDNEADPNALQGVDAFKGKLSSQCTFIETSRTIVATQGYSAILSAGAKIVVYYVTVSDVRELIGQSPFLTYTTTAQTAYSLSSNIYNDFAAPHIPDADVYVVYVLPETPVSASKYLTIMECRKLHNNAAVNIFARYGASSSYSVSASYAATINNGANVVTIALDFDSLGG